MTTSLLTQWIEWVIRQADKHTAKSLPYPDQQCDQQALLAQMGKLGLQSSNLYLKCSIKAIVAQLAPFAISSSELL